jgi:hypothetical protein
METMRKFKVGDEIFRARGKASWAPIGYKTLVLEDYKYLCKNGEFTPINDSQWELVKPKWTIYNNTQPWSELSDKQKGKMLLGRHTGLAFTTIDGLGFKNVAFDGGYCVYKAIKPEPVKPEPTMAELFLIDWQDCLCVGGKQEQNMIAKGWVKL